jgi:hypothetical protein
MFNETISDESLTPVAKGADINESRCECFGIGLIGDQPCPFHFEYPEYETPQAKARRLAEEATIPEAELPF